MAAAATAAALTPSAGARRPSTPTAATPATTANTANNDMEPATITPASPALRVGDLFWKQDGPSGWVLGQLMAHDAVARTARFSLVDEATGELLDEAAHPPMTLQLDESPLFAANPLFTTAADMTSLRHLHEAALAKNLEDRSSQQNQRPYTFMANVLIAVNPLKHLEEPDKNIFTAQSLDRCPPHPYYIAENAYRQLCAVRAVMQNQSIIISGESGSGKTETSKIILDFLTTRAKRTSRAPSCASEDDMMEPELTPRVVPLNESVTQAPRSDTGALSFPLSARGGSAIKLSPVALGERLMETIPILESFGNAKTHRNHNSSRFGKYMRLQFTNSTHELSGASIDTYLLEKSRLVSQPTGERNFHVFYELLYSKDESYLRDALFLSPKDPESYSYLNQSGCLKASELIDDAENFRSLCKALEFVGIYEAGQHEIFRIVAGLLHLGNVTISEEDTSEGKTACIAEGDIASQQALERASELLGVTKQELNECIFYKRIMTLAKTIYEHVFTWLMVQCASALDYDAARSDVIPYIGVLDIFGFEDFEPKNRNSFEQLLINYANEALQSLFNACIFEAEQVLYRSEHIYAPTNHSMSFPFPLPGVPLRVRDPSDFDFLNEKTEPNDEIEYSDNRECLTLIASKHGGIFVTIDNVSRLPAPSDRKLNERLHTLFKRHACFPTPHPKDIRDTFIVRHYAGTVRYTIDSFIDKNNNVISDQLEELLKRSTARILQEITGRNRTQSQTNFSNQAAKTNALGASKRQKGGSMSSLFSTQMKGLITELEGTACNFVRCIKPNTQMKPGIFDKPFVVEQLRCSGTVQACEVLRVGLPTRILYAEVVDVYKNILPFDMFQKFDYNEKLFTQAILWVYNFPTSAYRLGDTRLFFRTGKIDLLDKLLTPSTQKIDPANLASQMLLYLRKKRWIGAATKIMVYNAFKEIYYECKYRRKAITIQCMKLQDFRVTRVLKISDRELSVLGVFASDPAQHAAVLTIHRTAFDTSDMMELLRSLSLHVILENDIYSTYLGDVSRDMKPYKVSLIHPATDAHIRKHTDQAFHMVVETKQVYDEITEPFIASLPKEKIEWVYNILDHKTESERIIFEDADPVTGFILIPDFKWSDVTNLESIYCLAIVHDRSIRSLRDLRGKHLELLRNLREKSLRALQEQFGVLPSAFRIYVHYQPTYYHFHIHFSHVKLTEGTHTGKAVLLDNIIYNLSIDGDYYANADLAMVVGELQHQQLFERFVEHATTRRSQSTGDRGTVALPSPAKRGIAKPRFSRYLLVGFAIFQCFLGAGVVFGWTSILPMLEKERIYNELCKPDESFCEAQSVQLHFAFTIAASSSMFANLFLGILFDKYGPRISKLVSLVILMVGAIMMGRARVRTTASSSFDFFLPGMAFMAFGGTGLQLCSVHLSNLFPEAKSLVTCFMVGALQLSFFIFAIFAVLYDNFGLSQRAIFNGYTAILGVSLLGTVVLSPDKPYQLDSFARPSTESSQSTAEPEHELLSPIRLPSVFKKGETSLLLGTPHMNKEQLPTHVPPMALPARAAAGSASLERAIRFANDAHDYKSRSFKTQVLSPPFLLLTLLFSIGTLWCNYFLGSVTAQLRRKPLSAADVTTLMNDFGLLLPGGVVFIPLVGYLLEIWGHMRVTFATCLVSVAFTMCFFGSDHVGVLVLSFVLYTLYRTALFALLFSYIGHTFGFKNFGVLSGIAFSVAAVVGLLQTPLTEIPDFRVVGGIQLGTLLLSFALPIYDLVVTQRGRL
ncbi:hypothetical protein ATCC90586_008524 [Pythium insidiosum]|nr:hypothetical protein ATCC90586_008524 [Pythium insidiosum]